jgi:hypothetical protein
MLILQPPPKTLKVTRFVHAQARDMAWDATLDCETSPAGGVTMGVVYDIAESYTRGTSASMYVTPQYDGHGETVYAQRAEAHVGELY